MFGVYAGINSFQIPDHLVNRNHVRKFCFHIKQVPLNHTRNTVAHGSFGYNGLKPITGGIHDRVAHTGTGSCTHDNQGVHAQEIKGLGMDE